MNCNTGPQFKLSCNQAVTLVCLSLQIFAVARQNQGNYTLPWHNCLVLCCPLLLSPSVFPSIRVFSNELPLCIRWPKYWNFSISTSHEYSGLISFRIDRFDLLALLSNLYVTTGS